MAAPATVPKTPAKTRSRNYCFTLNNWTAENVTALKSMSFIGYCYMAEEIGLQRGIPHLQGYIQAKNALTFNALKKKFAKDGMHPHIESCRGSPEANITYCSKQAGIKHEWGTAKLKQGTRTDLRSMMEYIDAGHTGEEVRLEFPGNWYKYTRSINMHLKEVRDKATKAEIQADLNAIILRPWQLEVMGKLLVQNDRKVLWVVDLVGNNGKSFLAKHLCANHDAFYVGTGKAADIAYAYNFEAIVVFDLARQKQGTMNYSTIEAFKNGVMFSPKYESTSKQFKSAKIVVFSNWEPDLNCLSQDRWDIMRLGEPNVVINIPTDFVFEWENNQPLI